MVILETCAEYEDRELGRRGRGKARPVQLFMVSECLCHGLAFPSCRAETTSGYCWKNFERSLAEPRKGGSASDHCAPYQICLCEV